MKYVEMILSIDDANIIQFPSLLDRVVKWKEQGIKFIRMVTDAIRPSEVIHLSGTSNNVLVTVVVAAPPMISLSTPKFSSKMARKILRKNITPMMMIDTK